VGRRSQQPRRCEQRRWRCSSDCGGQKDQSTGHRASREQGEAGTILRKDKGSPQSAGHDGAHSTVVLPATRKKGDERRFPAKSSDQSWLAGCARNKQSYDGFAATGKTLRRRHRLDGPMAVASGKQRRRTTKNGDGEGLIARLRSTRKPRRSLLHASAKPKTATSAPRNQKKVAGGEVSSTVTVHQNYRIATRFKSQITPHFMWQLKNLQK